MDIILHCDCVVHLIILKFSVYIQTRLEIHPQKSTRHVKANVNTQKENQDHQKNNNEVEDIVLKKSFVTN